MALLSAVSYRLLGGIQYSLAFSKLTDDSNIYRHFMIDTTVINIQASFTGMFVSNTQANLFWFNNPWSYTWLMRAESFLTF
jgi:hypothetical protein